MRDLHADADRLSELNQELQRIHGELATIVGDGDPRGAVMLSQFGTTLRLAHEYLPFAQDAAIMAVGTREATARYVADRYKLPGR